MWSTDFGPPTTFLKSTSTLLVMKSNQAIVKEMEASLKTMERSINNMEETLSKAYDASQSTIAVNVGPGFKDELGGGMKANCCSNIQTFQNFKFTNHVIEFGPHNVFYNCTFIQCPLKFGPNNVFENCRDLQLKVVQESPFQTKSAPVLEKPVIPKEAEKVPRKSVPSQTDGSSRRNSSSRYKTVLPTGSGHTFSSQIPALFYVLV